MANSRDELPGVIVMARAVCLRLTFLLPPSFSLKLPATAARPAQRAAAALAVTVLCTAAAAAVPNSLR